MGQGLMLKLVVAIALGILLAVFVVWLLVLNADGLRELRSTLVSVPITIRDGDGSVGLLSLS